MLMYMVRRRIATDGKSWTDAATPCSGGPVPLEHHRQEQPEGQHLSLVLSFDRLQLAPYDMAVTVKLNDERTLLHAD